MNNCIHVGTFDQTLRICDCDINSMSKDVEAEKIRTEYLKMFDGNLVVHSSKCIFELDDCVEKCPFYEAKPF